MVDAVCVDPRMIDRFWPLAEPLLKPAMEWGLTDEAKIVRELWVANALLWLAWDGTEVLAAAITTINSSNGKKFCTIVACGGHHMEQWGFLVGKLEEFAKKEGCASIVIYGRKGWGKKLPEYGLRGVILERDLNG